MLTRLKRRTFRFQSCLKRAKASNILLIALFAATSMIWLMSFTRSSGANSALPMKTNSYIVEGGADDDEGLFTIGTEGQLNVTAAVLASSAGAVPFRVLFVCDVEVYDKKALPYTRWFIHLYKATSRLPGVEASIWGPGFSEYDEEGTLAENIKARWGSPTYFDFAFNYTTRYASQRVWRGPGVGGPPVAVLFKDCVMYEKLPSGSYSEVFPCVHEGADLYFHRSANNMGYYAYKGYGSLLWHLPPAVHKPLFVKGEDVPHEWRPIDILIVGCNRGSNRSLYSRLEEMRSRGVLPWNIYISQENGDENEDDSLYNKDEDECITDVEKNYQKYLYKLKRSKIVIVSAGTRGSDLRRYVEAAAAGALVVGDVPKEREEEVRKLVKVINYNDTDETILNTLSFWLSNTESRARVAKARQSYVLARYTTDNSAVEVVRAMQNYLYGQRGVFFGYKFEHEDHFLPRTLDCVESLE